MEKHNEMGINQEISSVHPSTQPIALSKYGSPSSIAFADKSLDISNLINVSEHLFQEEISDLSSLDSDNEEVDDEKILPNEDKRSIPIFAKKDWREEKFKFYNFKTIGNDRKWLMNILLSDNSESESDGEITENEFQEMLKMHVRKKAVQKSFLRNTEQCNEEYSNFASSLLSEHDKYHEKHKKRKKQKKNIKQTHVKKPINLTFSKSNIKKNLKKKNAAKLKLLEAKKLKLKLQQEKDMTYKRKKVWHIISKKEIPKMCRNKTNSRGTSLATLKKVAQGCQREKRKEAARSQKISKEVFPRAKRMAREMLLYWKKFDKVEKEHRKKAEKEAQEQRKQDEEMREMKRQQRKLNFLITQTELYAHFMSRKMKGNQDSSAQQTDILKKLDDDSNLSNRSVQGGILVNHNADDYDPEEMKNRALINAQNAVLSQEQKINGFDSGSTKAASQTSFDSTFSLANPTMNSKKQLPQPKIFEGKLKTYQLKGMNWLINLYEQGINGILADEMGLGKTVQSISLLAYLAEAHDIWGPFVIVSPASTLHNWQQEFAKFLPQFKVLPYWGDPSDRKSLRKFWNQTSSYLTDSEKAPFHVLITSYQLIVQDVKYFQRIKWQYLILDEAHAIKSSTSLRWKILLGYNCRNRLLLTGTPIQNTMAELWALLHFIMPMLFDNHEEFNEWFSKDIENHASEKKPNLDQNQLSRLHMILKPFMLRRVKKDVENELSEKIEIKVMCQMSSRQKLFYQAVKNKIMFEDLLQSTTSNSEKSTSLLMNLVMQFRKVCNHPELFERKEPSTGLFFKLPPILLSKFLYRNSLLEEFHYDKIALFEKYFLIWNTQNIYQSLEKGVGSFSFSRFINLSPKELVLLFRSQIFRLIHSFLVLTHLQHTHALQPFITRAEDDGSNFHNEPSQKKYLTRKDLLICSPQHHGMFNSSQRDFVFVRPTSTCSGFNSCKIIEVVKENSIPKCPEERHCVAVDYAMFLSSYMPKVYSPPIEVYCSDRSAAYQYKRRAFGTDDLLEFYMHGPCSQPTNRQLLFYPPPRQGLQALQPVNGWSRVRVPNRTALLSDSGKLLVLDQLLTRMKREGHRVLIYSQMTKMIDILEEFMNYRQHSYIRLDGSSKISDRRDMVNDFQSRDDIFAFLLSTRAGGLGINLTAADTVIFYDSDWNPTVDQQAMDRAHRLGQKRQVTVYRLVTKGTVEEKILNRAREKSEIQNIVISGGQMKTDVLRPKEVVSLLLDDVELEAKLKQKQAEKKLAEMSGKRPGRKRKNPVEQNNGEPSKLQRTVSDGPADVLKNADHLLQRTDSFESIDENSMSSIDFSGVNQSEVATDGSSRPPSATGSPGQSPSTSGTKRGRGRGRGRGGKAKSGSLAKAAASVAAAAGAMAGRDAAYAQYGYSFQKNS